MRKSAVENPELLTKKEVAPGPPGAPWVGVRIRRRGRNVGVYLL